MELAELRICFKKYPAYKESGVEWSDLIPKHWILLALKRITKLNTGGVWNENFSESGYPVYRSTEIDINGKWNVNEPVRLNLSSSDLSKVLLESGDLIVTKSSGSPEHIGKTALFSSEVIAGYSNFMQRIRMQNACSPLFYHYVLNARISKFQFKIQTKSTSGLGNLNGEILANLITVLPPQKEQTAIANFLDAKTAKIDNAIAQKEKMIALLKERKQIVIQNAVTKGIDPHVKMKESGVEWIGEIPEHWEVKRAKYLFYEVSERSQEGTEELLSVSHMTGVTPRSEKDVNMFMSEDYSGSKVCHEDDLIYNIMWAWMGALGIAKQTGVVSPSYGIYRQKNATTFNSMFLEFKLKSTRYIELYNKVSTGLHSSRLRFYAHMFMNMEIAFPDRKEQDEIAEFIETQSAKIDQAISLQQTQIEKLQEYKATLIDSAVTGKIKVNFD